MNLDKSTGNINLPTAMASKEPLTMSSREIAELVESRHDSVRRTVERLAERNTIGQPPMVDDLYVDAQGKERSISVYRLEKRDCLVVVAQLSPEFTARIVDRWQELEEQTKPNVIAFDPENPAQLRGLLVNYAERTQVAEARVVELEPLAEAFERLEASEGSVTPRVAAKMLDVPERKFVRWLEVNGWAFRQGKVLQGYSERRKQGYLEHEPRTFIDGTGEERTSMQLKITPKGIARLAKIFAKEAA